MSTDTITMDPAVSSSEPAPLRNMTVNIAVGTSCEHDDHPIIFERELGDGLLQFTSARSGGTYQVTDLMSGTARLPDAAWLEDQIREGRFIIKTATSGQPKAQPRPDYDAKAIDEMDPDARRRRFVVLELLKAGAKCSDPDVGRKLDTIFTDEVKAKWGARPAPGTARRWLRRVLGGDAAAIRLVDMMNMSGRVTRTPSPLKLDPLLRQFVEEGARWFYTNRGLRIVDVVARVDGKRVSENERRVAEGGHEMPLDPVSRSTITRAINAIRCSDTLTEKMGAEWVRRRWKVSGEGLRTSRLLELAIADDKRWDGIMVLDAERRLPVGRPWVTFIMDVHTRCILGWFVTFQDPTIYAALQTFKRACLPKVIRTERLARYPVLRSIFGRPSELLADNGSNYASPDFEDALLDCGTTLRLVAVRTPTHKAMIERFFRTIDTMLSAKLPGATLPPDLMRELDLDAASEAALTLSELDELIADCVYLYHITVHSALAMPPAKAWELSMRAHGVPVLDDPRRLDQYAGETYRSRVTRNGFAIRGHWFRGKQIAELADDLDGQEKPGDRLKHTFAFWAKVKLNPEDMSEAHVWNNRTNRYVTVASATPRYSAGLSLYQHLQIKAWAKRQGLEFNSEEERLAARNALNKRIQELAPEVAMRERRAMARMLGSSAVQRHQTTATSVTVEPRHDGMGPYVTTDAAADTREDGDTVTTRPGPKPVPTTAASPLDSTLNESAAAPDDDWDDDVELEHEEEFA